MITRPSIRVVLLVALLTALSQEASPALANDGPGDVGTTADALRSAGPLMDDPAPLVETEQGYSATTSGATVELPADPEEPLMLEAIDGSIGVELPIEAGFAHGVVDGSGALVYDGGDAPVSYAAVAAKDGGLQVLVAIEGAEAPTDYRFELSLPPGAALEATPDGGAQVFGADGVPLLAVAPPWAVDSIGNEVPTSYRVEGTALIQSVEHSGAIYPVVADPDFGFFGICDHFTGALHEIMSWNRTIQPAKGRAYNLRVVMTCGEAGRGGYGWRHIRHNTYGKDHVGELSAALRSTFGVGISEYTFWDNVASVILNGNAREVPGGQVVFERSQYFHQANNPRNCRRAEFKVYVMVGSGRVKTAFAQDPILRAC